MKSSEHMDLNKKIYVAGHRGMVGSAIVRLLRAQGAEQLLLPAREELDLREQASVARFFRERKPAYVFLAAAKVGGIVANDRHPADYLYDNLMIEANVMHAAHESAVDKLLFLGSTCIYPRLAEQPMREEALLSGPLEPTNQWYAIAKIAGIKLCQAYRRQHGCDFISAMPTNLYGPGDDFSYEESHVIPAMIRKMHEAKVSGSDQVTLWGTGTPCREFMHVDDLADAAVFLMQHYSDEQHINVGVGKDISIRGLAELIMETVGYEGELNFDTSKPDGTPRKLTDASRLAALGWQPSTSLPDGLRSTYAWYTDNASSARGR
jgi:GDP-L-fucose synthase